MLKNTLLRRDTALRILFALFLLAVIAPQLSCSGDQSQSSLGELKGCQLSGPPPFDLVLWHEGFSSGKSISVAELNVYLGIILEFAEQNNVQTVFVTAPAFGPDDPAEITNALRGFVESLVAQGIGIGIQFGLSGDISDTSWFDYSSVSAVVGPHAYVLGLDSENYSDASSSIKASNTMNLINFLKTQIDDAGARQPDQIIVAGTAGYNPADGWAPPLVNFYEYYSSPSALNGVLASNVNQPGTAFDACLDQSLLKNPTASGGGIGSAAVPGWPAFSFEQAGSACLAASIQPAGICGSFDIFGEWSFDCVLQFMTLFKEQYYAESDRPTFVLYQSDYLPCSWLDNGCPNP